MTTPKPPAAAGLRRALACLTVATLGLGLPTVLRAQDRPRRTETVFSPNGGSASTTAAMIDTAERELDIAMYSMSTSSSSPIFAALERAAARGVKIRMILNKVYSGARNKQKGIALEKIGVDVLYVRKTMHEKFAVIDRRLLLNGSANWSTSADKSHSENMQVIPSPRSLVRAFRREYRTLLAESYDFTLEEFE